MKHIVGFIIRYQAWLFFLFLFLAFCFVGSMEYQDAAEVWK